MSDHAESQLNYVEGKSEPFEILIIFKHTHKKKKKYASNLFSTEIHKYLDNRKVNNYVSLVMLDEGTSPHRYHYSSSTGGERKHDEKSSRLK